MDTGLTKQIRHEPYYCEAVRTDEHIPFPAAQFLPALVAGPEAEKDRVVHPAFPAGTVLYEIRVPEPVLHVVDYLAPGEDIRKPVPAKTAGLLESHR